ncbi:LacI family DNA-binding transcriptional regulator [Brachybacterium sp. UNK5269]|uniref:LacI family DNA-binding transcriptional regulator n=1 Tax=Brachybacterium sp. UNK5269 TaxID=3408576 RepID=UPI003BB20B44
MTDIAREAGVSLSTVSYALSGKRPISAQTRERIQTAIARLEYHPAASARALALKRTSLLGVAVPQREAVDADVIMEFVGSFLAAAHEKDFDILLVTAEDHDRTLRVVEEGKVDALIVMDLVEDDSRIPSLAKLTRPVVLIGYPEENGGLTCVDFDFLAAAKSAVHEMHSRGSERIAMIAAPGSREGRTPTYAHRARLGYRRACQALGLEEHIIELSADPAEVSRFTRDEVLAGHRFDGLFVHHEGALPLFGRAFTSADIRSPEQVQVVAIAPERAATTGPWDVSAVDLPTASIGHNAVTMVLEQLADQDAPRHSRLLSPRFHARGTTRS